MDLGGFERTRLPPWGVGEVRRLRDAPLAPAPADAVGEPGLHDLHGGQASVEARGPAVVRAVDGARSGSPRLVLRAELDLDPSPAAARRRAEGDERGDGVSGEAASQRHGENPESLHFVAGLRGSDGGPRLARSVAW